MLKIDKLHRSEDFEALFNYATLGIVAVDSNGFITMVNPFLLTQFGYEDKNELIGQQIEILIPLNMRGRHVSHRKHYNSNPQNRPMGMGGELQGLKKDGSVFPVEISLSYYKKNNKQYAFAFITDITHRKEIEQRILFLNRELQEVAAELDQRVQSRTKELSETITQLDSQVKETQEAKTILVKSEEELKTSLEKEKELSKLKSRSVSTASHEFRTPLSAILSSVFLLSKYTSEEDQPKRDKHIGRITSAVALLTEILNDFLSVSKIEEGRIEVSWKEFDLAQYIQSLLNDMQTILKNGQKFSYHHNGDAWVTLDVVLLKHVVLNLASNAIKFSPENATIEINTNIDGESTRLCVKDAGIGISQEDQKHLFERFYRASNASHIQGTGLGLHIVSKYVEMLNGKIYCNSELEKGTEFIIVFEKSKNNSVAN